MKILISGAGGRMAAHLLTALRNHELVLLDLNAPRENSHGTFYELNLLDYDKLEEILTKEKPQAIIHLAGLLGDACDANKELAYKLNVEATIKLASLGQLHGCEKFLFASSAAVYTQLENKPVTEAETNPANYYGETKLEAETKLNELKDFSALSLRIFNVYGPGFDHSLVNKLATSQADNPVEIIDPDNYIRDYIHIGDVIKAFELGLKYAAGKHTALNIASGIAMSTTQLIAELKTQGFNLHTKVVPGKSDRYSLADISKAEQLVGFNPSTKLITDGIA